MEAAAEKRELVTASLGGRNSGISLVDRARSSPIGSCLHAPLHLHTLACGQNGFNLKKLCGIQFCVVRKSIIGDNGEQQSEAGFSWLQPEELRTISSAPPETAQSCKPRNLLSTK